MNPIYTLHNLDFVILTCIMIIAVVIVMLHLYCYCNDDGLTCIVVAVAAVAVVAVVAEVAEVVAAAAVVVVRDSINRVVHLETVMPYNAHNLRRSVCHVTPVKFAENRILVMNH